MLVYLLDKSNFCIFDVLNIIKQADMKLIMMMNLPIY